MSSRLRSVQGCLLTTCLGLIAAGCAGVHHRQVQQALQPHVPGETEPDPGAAAVAQANAAGDIDTGGGLRYYGTSMYLLVHPTGKGTIKWQLMELPDQTKLMVADPRQFLSSVDSRITLHQGAAVLAKDEVDAAAVPKAVGGALASILPEVLPTQTAGPTGLTSNSIDYLSQTMSKEADFTDDIVTPQDEAFMEIRDALEQLARELEAKEMELEEYRRRQAALAADDLAPWHAVRGIALYKIVNVGGRVQFVGEPFRQPIAISRGPETDPSGGAK